MKKYTYNKFRSLINIPLFLWTSFALLLAMSSCGKNKTFPNEQFQAITNDLKTTFRVVQFTEDNSTAILIKTGDRIYQYNTNTDCEGMIDSSCPLMKGFGFGSANMGNVLTASSNAEEYKTWVDAIVRPFQLTGSINSNIPASDIDKKFVYSTSRDGDAFFINFKSAPGEYYYLGCKELADAFGLKKADFQPISLEDFINNFNGQKGYHLNCRIGEALSGVGTPTPLPTHPTTLQGWCEQAARGPSSSLTADEVKSMQVLRSVVADPTWTDWNCPGTIERLSSLTTLTLTAQSVKSMEPIGLLPQLKELKLDKITDVSSYEPLAKLDKLQIIKITNSGLNTLEFLRNSAAKGVLELNFEGNNLTDVSPLLSFPYVKKISLANNPEFENLTYLSSFAGLLELNLLKTAVNSLTTLAGNRNLVSLNLQNTKIISLAGLEDAPLKELNISETLVKDLIPLKNNKTLEKLYLEKTAIPDLIPVANIATLADIRVKGNPNIPFNGFKVLWSFVNGAIGLWYTDAWGNYAGQTLNGPFPGWRTVNYSGNKVLNLHTSGKISLWTVDNYSNVVSFVEHGPIPGWTPINYANNKILWRHTDGRIAIWCLDEKGNYVTSTNFGPFPTWIPVNIADNHILFRSSTGDKVSLWSIDDSGKQKAFKEYPVLPGWSPVNYSDGRVFWKHTSGKVAFWQLNDINLINVKEHGPFPDWSPVNYSHGKALFLHKTGKISIWTLTTIDKVIYFIEKGPFPGWAPINFGSL